MIQIVYFLILEDSGSLFCLVHLYLLIYISDVCHFCNK